MKINNSKKKISQNDRTTYRPSVKKNKSRCKGITSPRNIKSTETHVRDLETILPPAEKEKKQTKKTSYSGEAVDM